MNPGLGSPAGVLGLSDCKLGQETSGTGSLAPLSQQNPLFSSPSSQEVLS